MQAVEWRQGSCVLGITWYIFYYVFNFLQDREINMMLQEPILLGSYDASEEDMVEVDTQSFIEETTTDKFRRIDGDRTMEIYI